MVSDDSTCADEGPSEGWIFLVRKGAPVFQLLQVPGEDEAFLVKWDAIEIIA